MVLVKSGYAVVVRWPGVGRLLLVRLEPEEGVDLVLLEESCCLLALFSRRKQLSLGLLVLRGGD